MFDRASKSMLAVISDSMVVGDMSLVSRGVIVPGKIKLENI